MSYPYTAPQELAFKSRCLGALADLARLRFLVADLRHGLTSKYSDDQPRDERGRWTPGGGGKPEHAGAPDTLSLQPPGSIAGADRSAERIRLAANFSSDQLAMPVQIFVSQNCLGSINRVLPGQFLGMTVGQVQSLAGGGDAAARTCMKLLGNNQYRK